MIESSEFLTIHLDSLLVRERMDRFKAFLNNTDLPKLLQPSMEKLAQIALISWNSVLVDSTLETNQFQIPVEVDTVLAGAIANSPAYSQVFNERAPGAALFDSWNRLLKVALNIKYDNLYLSEADEWIQAWLEEQWARAILEISSQLSCKDVLNILEKTEVLHDFIRPFINLLPHAWLEADRLAWTKVDDEPEKMIESWKHDDYAFEQYSRREPISPEPMDLASIKRIQLISQNLIFSEKFYLQTFVLRERKIAMWAQFWDNLKHPLLQAAALNTISSVEKIKDILLALKNKIADLKTPPSELAILLLDRYFHILTNSWQILRQFEKDLPEPLTIILQEKQELMVKGRFTILQWITDKDKLGREIAALINEVASPLYITDWLFSLQPISGGHPEYVSYYNAQLSFLRSLLEPMAASIPIEDQINHLEKSFSFSRIQLLSVLLNKLANKESLIRKLLETLKKYLRGKKYVWRGVFDPQAVEGINATANVIALLSDPAHEYNVLFDEFIANFEGWNVRTDEFSNIASIDSFLFASTIPYLEQRISGAHEDIDVILFKVVLDKIIRQVRYFDFMNYYTPVLSRLANTATLLGLQDFYDEKVITEVDNLFDVLEIVHQHAGVVSEKNNALLKERVETEMTFEKLRLRDSNPADKLKRMDRILNDFGL